MQHTTGEMLLFEPNTTSLIHCTVTNKLYLIQNGNASNNSKIKIFNSKFDLKFLWYDGLPVSSVYVIFWLENCYSLQLCLVLKRLRNKKLGTFVLWVIEENRRCRLFDNRSLINEDDPICYLTGKPHLMCNNQHCHTRCS